MAGPTGSTENPESSTQPPAAATADAQIVVAAGAWERIKEHKILQWVLGYLGVAIAIAHGQELMAEAFEWPHVIGRVLMSVLVLGLPLVLALAWYHGHKGLKRIGPGELGIMSLLILIAAGLLVLFVRAPPEQALPRTVPTVQSGALRSSDATATSPTGVSLAVLPFVDMSPEHNQEYFSDGLSEELLNQLAHVQDLQVTGRTSSFSFKGKNEDLRIIGEKLGVGNILEGSVRKDGERLRITAQLNSTKDGTHLWSQTYDRKLTDVFAVQEDIAKAVTSALSIRLDVGDMSRAQGGTTNVEAYDLYLRGRSLRLQGGRSELLQSTEIMRKAVSLDPAFARAWLEVAVALRETVHWTPENRVAVQKEQAEATARVVALAPNAWWTQALRIDDFLAQHRWAQAEAARSAVLRTAPAGMESQSASIAFLMTVGRIKDAVSELERVRLADPLSLGVSGTLQVLLDRDGRPLEAQAEYERSKPLVGNHGQWDHYALFRLLARKNADPTAVKTQFRAFLQHETVPMALNRVLFERLEDKVAARAALRQAFDDPANQDVTRMLILGIYADLFGDKDLALAAQRRNLVDLGADLAELWLPYVTGLRTDPRFKDLLRETGLASYFRSSGNWGDFCKPVGEADFECH